MAKTKRLTNLEIKARLINRTLHFVPDEATQKRVIEAIKWLELNAGTATRPDGGFSVRYGPSNFESVAETPRRWRRATKP